MGTEKTNERITKKAQEHAKTLELYLSKKIKKETNKWD